MEKNRIRTAVTVILLLGFLCLFFAGSYDEDGPNLVLRKAVAICLQCIGIG